MSMKTSLIMLMWFNLFYGLFMIYQGVSGPESLDVWFGLLNLTTFFAMALTRPWRMFE